MKEEGGAVLRITDARVGVCCKQTDGAVQLCSA